ncbi:MAG: hypothetical protein ACI9JN_001482 [Bacteroidia bacterium]
MNSLDDNLYLVGGQSFMGRYNPMAHNTYVQRYSDQIRSFTVNNSGSQLAYSNYAAVTDGAHLHRRDYSLLPQVFPNGSKGLIISSGVFQTTVDLPFLYPVEITSKGYTAVTRFNQYLSNYHSAHISLFDSANNRKHMLFFGGMSQCHYADTTLVQDDNVPFVKTTSRLTRSNAGVLKEFQLDEEMPKLHGAGSELIIAPSVPMFSENIMALSKLTADSVLVCHIVGGISSPTENPFTSNQSGSTLAETTVYEVYLVKDKNASIQPIDGTNPYRFNFSPNPISDVVV